MLNLDKSGWETVRFGDVVRNMNETVRDAAGAGIEKVIALEHLDPGEVTIQRYGDTSESTTFTRRVHPGQTLFGKRRAYQRKAAYAEVDAICSGDILVFEANPMRLSARLLPFLVHSEPFFAHALGTSAGSLSPRTNWKSLAAFEFSLPPLEEQERIADLLWGAAEHRHRLRLAMDSLGSVCETWRSQRLGDLTQGREMTIGTVADRLCYGVVQPGDDTPSGVPLIRVCDLENGTPDPSAVKRVAESIHQEYARSQIAAGDVLVSIVGTIGRTWVVTPQFAGSNIARAIAKVSVRHDVILPDFLGLVLSSAEYATRLREAAFESARRTLNLNALAALSIPVPPLETQKLLLGVNSKLLADIERLRGESMATLRISEIAREEVFGGCNVH